MTHYSFPILRPVELIQCFRELNFEGVPDDLIQKPTPESVKPLYEYFIEYLTGSRRDEYQQAQFAGLDCFEFPELHEESVGEIGFWRALAKLMAVVGVGDFSIRDIHKPEPARTQRNFSAIINFVKFREERMQKYKELTERTDDLFARRQRLDQENNDLETQISKIKAARAAEEPQIDGLRKETQAMETEIHSLNREQAVLNGELKTLKQATAELAEKISNSKFAIVNTKQETSKMRSQIVQSPQRFKKTLEDMTNTLDSERTATAEADKRARDLQARLEALAKIEKDVAKCMKLLGTSEEEMGKWRRVAAEVKEAQDAVLQKERSLTEMSTEEALLQRRLKTAQGNSTALKEKHGERLRAAQAALASAQMELRAAEERGLALAAAVESNQRMAQKLESELGAMQEGHEAEVAAQQVHLTGR
eukprot:tig00000704_g3349.t1